MRELKHHEKKLLRKVSLYSWKGEDNLRVAKVMRIYHIQNRDDFVAYQRICGQVTKLSAKLKVRQDYYYYLTKSVDLTVLFYGIFFWLHYNTHHQTLKPDDSFRIAMTEQLLEKLFNMGIINTQKSLQKADEITASAICRRRLPVVMVRLKMAQNVKNAVEFVEQGQVRIGPNVVTDPAFLVTKTMEDFVTWVDSSKVRRAVHKYNDKLDDFDLL